LAFVRHTVPPVLGGLVLGWGVLAALARSAEAGCPRHPVELAAAGFARTSDAGSPPKDLASEPVTLPDSWRERRPEAGGLAWYRFSLDPVGEEDADARRCGVFLPDANMNAAVFVNGNWIGEGGSLTEPVSHNFNRPLYFSFPSSLLHGRDDRIDVLLYAYADHFGRLGPIRFGSNAALQPEYEWTFFRQITLAEVGTALALMTALFVAAIWIGSRFEPVYGFFLGSTVAWAINSLNYWVSDIPMPHWAWDRLMNGALDQFAVFLAFFFHRVVEVHRPRTERALVVFSIAAVLAAAFTPRPHFAEAMVVTHAIITMIGAYVTILSWTHRGRLGRGEAYIYLGAWALQLCFSVNDLGIQAGFWTGLGYMLPYTVSCMMVAFGSTLALRFVRALREARTLNEALEERVRAREKELALQFERHQELERREILGRERQRLMREMHDGLGGQLVSSLALVEAGEHTDAELVSALRDSIEELRLVILSLDPGLSDVSALLAALRMRLEPVLQRRGISFRWRVGATPTPTRFGPEVFLSLLRIAQEAIANAVRHADPSSIEVATAVSEGHIAITIRDDGCGFREPKRRGRGLGHMERRAQELGGELVLDSGPAGTRVEIRLPLRT